MSPAPFLLKQRNGAQDYMIAMIFIEKIMKCLKAWFMRLLCWFTVAVLHLFNDKALIVNLMMTNIIMAGKGARDKERELVKFFVLSRWLCFVPKLIHKSLPRIFGLLLILFLPYQGQGCTSWSSLLTWSHPFKFWAPSSLKLTLGFEMLHIIEKNFWFAENASSVN